MNSNNPISLGDVTYDKFNINLAISTNNDDTNVALRLIPSDGGVNTLDSNTLTLYKGGSSELDEIESIFMNSIKDALQVLINNKGW